jgi:hypothetical protein
MRDNSGGMYDDPNSPKWPNNGVPFNRWYSKLHAFLYALQTQFYWGSHPLFGKVKYLNIRVDTRNGGFLVFREADKSGDDPVQITPDELRLEFKDIQLQPALQLMDTAPRDRPILLKTNYDVTGSRNSYCIAQYAEWGGNERPPAKMWETGFGEGFSFDSKAILGWWELPND